MKKLLILFTIILVFSSCSLLQKTVVLDASTRTLVYSNNCTSLDGFNNTSEGFYNDNPVWFTPKSISLTDQGIQITCTKNVASHTTWQGTRTTTWDSGLLDTENHFEMANGLWVIEAKLNGGWPAIWLLKKPRKVTGYVSDKIIPEVDIVETIQGKFRNTVHWGYSDDVGVYRRNETGKFAGKYDEDFHKFAVDLLPNGYDFYIDGKLVYSPRNKDPEFVSNDVNFLILNNAANLDTPVNTTMIIRSIKVYK